MSFISKIWQNKDKEYNINIQITSAMNVNFVTEMVKKVPRFSLTRYLLNTAVEYFVLFFYRKEHANYDHSKSNRHFEKEKDLEGGQRRSVEKEIGVQGGTWGMQTGRNGEIEVLGEGLMCSRQGED